MNTFYIRAAGLSLSLLVLLPISATVPNGNDVLVAINGAPAVTTTAAQEKINSIIARMKSDRKVILSNPISKMAFANMVIECLQIAQLARLYVQNNNLKPNSLSKVVTDGLEIAAQKHAEFSVTPDEKEHVHNCVLATMKLVDLLQETKIVAQATDSVKPADVEKVYQEMLQQIARYNLKVVPTYNELQPYLKLAVAATQNPALRAHLAHFRELILKNLNVQYKLTVNEENIRHFLLAQPKGL